MTAFIDSMAHNPSVISTPWHKNSTAAVGSIDDILAASGIDTPISSRIARMRVSPDTDETVEIPGYFFVTRDRDNYVYQCVTNRYKIVQNYEIVEFFREWCDEGGIELATVGALKDGAIVFATAKTGKGFTIKGQDATDQYLTFARSHDGTLCNVIWVSGVCVVCWNTLQLALGDAKDGKALKKKSTTNFDVMGSVVEAKEKLGFAVKTFERLHETADYLSERPVDFHGGLMKEFLVNLTAPTELKKLVPEFKLGSAEKLVTDKTLNRVALKITDAMLMGPGQELSVRQNTWWGALNGVTHYVDHIANQNKGVEKAATSAMFGTGEALKQRALELVPAYAML